MNMTEPKDYDQLGQMMAWEDGALDEDETIELFTVLVRNGQAWSLQGMYGRQAMALIKAGLIPAPTRADD